MSLLDRLDELDPDEVAILERMAEDEAQWPTIYRPTLPDLRQAIAAWHERHATLTLAELRRRLGA